MHGRQCVRSWTWALLTALIWLVSACETPENGERGFEVSGVVTDSLTGNPIVFAFVSWGDPGSGYLGDTTDANGAYRIGVPESAHQVFASKDQYATKIIPLVNFHSDRDGVDFELAPQ